MSSIQGGVFGDSTSPQQSITPPPQHNNTNNIASSPTSSSSQSRLTQLHQTMSYQDMTRGGTPLAPLQTTNLSPQHQRSLRIAHVLNDASHQSDTTDSDQDDNLLMETSHENDFSSPILSKNTSPRDDFSLSFPQKSLQNTIAKTVDDLSVQQGNKKQYSSNVSPSFLPQSSKKSVHFDSLEGSPGPEICFPADSTITKRRADPSTAAMINNDNTSPFSPPPHQHHSHQHSTHCSHSRSTDYAPNSAQSIDNTDTFSHYSSYSAYSGAHSWAATSLVSIGSFTKRFIGSFHHAPHHVQMYNIFTGYRLNYSSIKDCIVSLFELHNETSSCWSHIFGMVLFLVLAVYRYNTILYLVEDRILFWTYIYYYLGSAVCMMFSFSYHLFCCMNKEVHDQLYQLDMTGILLMIIANIMHPMMLLFYCEQSRIGVIYAFAALICGTILAIAQNVPYCLQPKFFVYRISAIILYGASALVPFFQFQAWFGNETQLHTVGFTIIITFMIYGIGVLFWIFKFPECLFSSVFDLGLYSHAIWHCCIIIGSLWTEQGFIHVLVKVVDETWCPAPILH